MEPLKEGQRYRCKACGGLTRFEVTLTCRLRYFHHQTVSGEMTPENEEILDEVIEEVICVWCGHGKEVEVEVMEGPDTGG